jgi:hypothetical protein
MTGRDCHVSRGQPRSWNTVTAVAIDIPAGSYRIEVRASVQGANGFGTGLLGDSSLIVSF